MNREYRVRWQRESMPKRTAIYQTRRGAEAKVEALLWSDSAGRIRPIDASDDYFRRTFTGMPKLIGRPQIESRTVGEWEFSE